MRWPLVRSAAPSTVLPSAAPTSTAALTAHTSATTAGVVRRATSNAIPELRAAGTPRAWSAVPHGAPRIALAKAASERVEAVLSALIGRLAAMRTTRFQERTIAAVACVQALTGAHRGRSAIRASISAPDLGIFSHASSFIRIPGTNKIREYGSNLQLIKFERWLRWSAQIFFKYVRLCVPEATDVSQIMWAQVDFDKIRQFLESRAQIVSRDCAGSSSCYV